MAAMDPGEYCRLALSHLTDWVPTGADQAAIAVLLSHFARARPAEALFLESLRALARDPNNGSLADAARAIHDGWRAAQTREHELLRPLRLRGEDRASAPGAAGAGGPSRPVKREAGPGSPRPPAAAGESAGGADAAGPDPVRPAAP